MPAAAETLCWDVFCRVVDNHGDLGVCWRLARGLAELGQGVRLWVDDASGLQWMAPGVQPQPLTGTLPGPGTIGVHAWDRAATATPADVVVEAFGCDPPAAFVQRIPRDARPFPTVWINLEYLSAEDYVERSHRLPSPQHAGAGAGLTKWFFYPGFTTRTGGLLPRHGHVGPTHDAASRRARLSALGLELQLHAHPVSLFCYRNPALPSLLSALAARTDVPAIDLLVAPGLPQAMVNTWLARQGLPVLPEPGQPSSSTAAAHGTSARPVASIDPGARLRVHALPYLPQTVHDRIFPCCDLNFVRGEDTLVTGLWSQRPLVWHIYPQDDGAHEAKLEAFLDHYLPKLPSITRDASRALHHAWNAGQAPAAAHTLLESLFQLLTPQAQADAEAYAQDLAAREDLLSRLLSFVADKRRVRQPAQAG